MFPTPARLGGGACNPESRPHCPGERAGLAGLTAVPAPGKPRPGFAGEEH